MSTEKLLKVAKELRKASQMHANQAKVVANMAIFKAIIHILT